MQSYAVKDFVTQPERERTSPMNSIGPTHAVVGIDLGGSTTRIAVASTDGVVLSRISVGPANVRTHSRLEVQETLGRGLDAALLAAGRPAVLHACVGAAGVMGDGDDDLRGVESALAGAGAIRWTIRSDIEIAYAAGSSDPDGSVIIAGTGAVAARMSNGHVVRTSDGYGWLLGDLGSGHWIGVEATRAALRALDAGGVLDGTRMAWLRLLLDDPDAEPTAGAVVGAASSATPGERARLARLVLMDAAAGDAVAQDIVARAASHLRNAVGEVGWQPGSPLVLAGGLLSSGSAVADEFVRQLGADSGPWLRFDCEPVEGAIKIAAAAARSGTAD